MALSPTFWVWKMIYGGSVFAGSAAFELPRGFAPVLLTGFLALGVLLGTVTFVVGAARGEAEARDVPLAVLAAAAAVLGWRALL